jgi:hypothetical protein
VRAAWAKAFKNADEMAFLFAAGKAAGSPASEVIAVF